MTKELKYRIMVAEDFPLLREDICELIDRQDDMEIVGSADSGAAIIQLASDIEFDLILMDIEMEKINSGIIATETIRSLKADANIIFLTAHETNDMIVTAMGAGAIDYIVKGCEDDVIIQHIRNAIEGNPIMDGRVHETIMEEYARLRKSERSLLFFINTVSKLTISEREIITLLLQGKKVAEIASLRCVETVTVKTQIKGLLRKFGCGRTKDIVKMINELNIRHLFISSEIYR